MLKNETISSQATLENVEGSETISKESTLSNILNGSACPVTGNADGDDIVRQKNFELFLLHAHEKFGDKFDYSKLNYITIKTPGIIGCPEHGYYILRPEKHLLSMWGCPQCAAKYKRHSTITDAVKLRLLNSRYSEKTFLTNAYKKFGTDYLIVINRWDGITNADIDIICPEHGKLHIQNPYVYLKQKYRCPVCARIGAANTKCKTYDTIVMEMSLLYNNFYTYSESNREIYKNLRTKIAIDCPIHGRFYKSPNKHILAHQGCPKCNYEKNLLLHKWPGGYNDIFFEQNPMYKGKDAILYYLEINQGEYYKIGITTTCTKDRIKHFIHDAKAFENKFLDIIIINELHTTLYNAYIIEQYILENFAEFNVKTTWSTELFNKNIYNEIQIFF